MAVGSAMLAFAGPVMALVGIFGALMAAIVSVVGLFDPSIVKMFKIAMEDTFAVLGEIFRPVVVVAIDAVRIVGDAIASMKPAIDPMVNVISQFVTIGAKQFVAVMILFLPLLQALGSILLWLMPLLNGISDLIVWVAKAIQWLVTQIINMINWLIRKASVGYAGKEGGFQTFGEMEPRSSVGKSVRGTERMSAESFGAKFREAAYGASSPMQENTQALKSLTDAIKGQKWDDIKSAIMSGLANPEGATAEDRSAIKDNLAGMVQTVDRLVSSFRSAGI
jgi:hypothetical protein